MAVSKQEIFVKLILVSFNIEENIKYSMKESAANLYTAQSLLFLPYLTYVISKKSETSYDMQINRH